MTTSGKAASIHDRLLALARTEKSDFNLLLMRYALERFLYRLSVSPHGDRFILKGALLFSLWFDTPQRPTRDADLLGLETIEMDEIVTIFRSVCSVSCDDGMTYDESSIKTTEIRENAHYGGIRVDVMGKLGNARCNIQVDIGFGDAVTPAPITVQFPTLIKENQPPRLGSYPKETVIAEKLEAIVTLGMANSRMKDYYDLSLLLGEAAVDMALVSLAVRRTFERRRTPLPRSLPLGLSEEFASDKNKLVQWQAFISKNSLSARDLSTVVAGIREKVLHLGVFSLASNGGG